MKLVEAIEVGGVVVLAACAVVLTTAVLHRRSATAVSGAASVSRPHALDATTWRDLISVGHRMGPENARITVLEFGDFECPYCQRFNTVALRAVVQRYPTDVAVVFREWPLPYHHLAYPAAVAAECADAQGRFWQYFDELYSKQDSLGLKSFGRFAEDAGVADTVRFAECIAHGAADDVISRDSKAAVGLGALGTPTIVINGEVYPIAPDSATFDRTVRGLLGKEASE